MTLFGWIYLVLTVFGALSYISEIGQPRKPLTSADVSLRLIISGLLFWGLYVWGIRA